MERDMPSAKIVIGEVQRKRSFQVLPLLAEAVRQPCQPSHAHAHGEVLPFNVRRADFVLVWVTVDRCGDRFHYIGRTVAAHFFGRLVLVYFDELRIVHALSLVS